MKDKNECENCGCREKITSLGNYVCRLSTKLDATEGRVDGMIMRLNVMLGMIAVAVIMFLVDILLK